MIVGLELHRCTVSHENSYYWDRYGNDWRSQSLHWYSTVAVPCMRALMADYGSHSMFGMCQVVHKDVPFTWINRRGWPQRAWRVDLILSCVF